MACSRGLRDTNPASAHAVRKEITLDAELGAPVLPLKGSLPWRFGRVSFQFRRRLETGSARRTVGILNWTFPEFSISSGELTSKHVQPRNRDDATTRAVVVTRFGDPPLFLSGTFTREPSGNYLTANNGELRQVALQLQTAVKNKLMLRNVSLFLTAAIDSLCWFPALCTRTWRPSIVTNTI